MTRAEAEVGTLVRIGDLYGVIENADPASVIVRWEDGHDGLMVWSLPICTPERLVVVERPRREIRTAADVVASQVAWRKETRTDAHGVTSHYYYDVDGKLRMISRDVQFRMNFIKEQND